MGNEEWTIQRDRTTNNTKPVREWVIKNGQSRETERQTTQNQLENGDCPFFITPSLTVFVLFVVLSLWIVHSSLLLL
jgi:hypothetical protein